MMTAAEVDYVFNLKECSVEGYEAAAFATAGLSIPGYPPAGRRR